jgi:hypothetical protein
MHLDIRVSDADKAERELLARGATRIPGEGETGFRVFTDPVGHPFCIVFGRTSTDRRPDLLPTGHRPVRPRSGRRL